MENVDSEISCVIDGRVLRTAATFVNGGYTEYGFRSLNQLLEAVIIYDKVKVFDAHPIREMVESTNFVSNRLVSELLNLDGDLIAHSQLRDSYDSSVEWDNLESPIFNGICASGTGLQCPASCLEEARSMRNSDLDREIMRALKICGYDDLLPEEHASNYNKNLLFDYFLGHSLWVQQLSLPQLHNAIGRVFSNEDTILSIGLGEQDFSAKKMSMVQSKLLDKHLPGCINVDFSPLMAILLDTTLNLEMLPETLFQMRNDYSEIRRTNSKYYELINSAESYGEIAELSHEWESIWTSFISRIGKSNKSIISRIFVWDNAKPSSKKVGIALAKAISERQQESHIRKSMDTFFMLEKEFLSARKIQNSLAGLFSDI